MRDPYLKSHSHGKWDMMPLQTKIGLFSAIGVVVLSALGITIGLLSNLGTLQGLRIVYGTMYVLVLPGLIFSFVFFPKTHSSEEKDHAKGSIDWIERIALSFGLSIALVPLAVFYLNLVGMKITIVSSFLTILVICIIGCAIIWMRRIKQHSY